MHYKNFTTTTYAHAGYLQDNSIEQLREDIDKVARYVKLDKIYLEAYRSEVLVDRDKMKAVKELYSGKGYELSGGITTTTTGTLLGSMCYTSQETRKKLGDIITYLAEEFDEIMIDDFYFTNCRCAACIEAKGDRDWASFRLALMNDISENVVLKAARAVKPDINMIIKFPNWYEGFANCGYNLKDESPMFDMVFTGTETRDQTYTQQNLASYLSFFLPRLLERIKPGKNGGGWYDLFESSIEDYLKQAYLTLFSKCKEQMMFCLPVLAAQPSYTAAAGAFYDDADAIMGEFGEPTGVACYEPYTVNDNTNIEPHLYDFLGMLGIPLDPYPYYPESASTVLLTASSARDDKIIEKMKKTMMDGGNVFITSGLYQALADKGIEEILPLLVTNKKATTDTFKSNAFGWNNGTFEKARGNITIPHIAYNNNDVWMLSAAMTSHYSHPMLLCTAYGSGNFYVLTIPDSPDDLYKLPADMLTRLRTELKQPIVIECGAGIGLFTYDNETFILQSFLTRPEKVRVRLKDAEASLELLLSSTPKFAHRMILNKIGDSLYEVFLIPGRHIALRIV